jgi:ribose transport system ATP-binding protein
MSRPDSGQGRARPPGEPVLVVRNLSKTFASQSALAGVELTLYAGEVHALLGHNGSGKSTLIKVLAGYHKPDPGAAVTIANEPLEFGSGPSAHQLGLRFIHQELDLIDDLSVIDNFAMGRGYSGSLWVGLRREASSCRRAIAPFLPEVDPNEKVGTLTQSQKTLLAIARALSSGTPRVLVLDEPTVSLAAPQVDELFKAIRQAKQRGVAILYVSHNLEEIVEIADRVTVLRDGLVSGVVPDTAGLEVRELVALVLGAEGEMAAAVELPGTKDNESLLTTSGLRGITLRSLSFDLHPGELVGFAGLEGSGREEVGQLLGGAMPSRGGSIAVAGTPVGEWTPSDALRQKVVYVAADRKRASTVPSLTVRENITITDIPCRGPLRWTSLRAERADAQKWALRSDVPTTKVEEPLSTLSGGNQQKVVLARAMRSSPRVLIMDQPLQGIDVGARAGIVAQVRKAASEGVAVVVSSSEAEDLELLCTRVLVLRRGRVVAQLIGDEIAEARIVRHALDEAASPTNK